MNTWRLKITDCKNRRYTLLHRAVEAPTFNDSIGVKAICEDDKKLYYLPMESIYRIAIVKVEV